MLGLVLWLSLKLATIQANMEGFILGGSYAEMKDFSYAAYLSTDCIVPEERSVWECGSTIINQRILITAAHCLDCDNTIRIIIRLGHDDRKNGSLRSSSGFLIHGLYNSFTSSYDIGLVKTSRPMKFGETIKRIAFMKHPPYSEPGKIVGWGLTDVITGSHSTRLKKLDQKVLKNKICQQMLKNMPGGTICAKSRDRNAFAAPGDSGAGLVVRGFILIGVVSYKTRAIAENVIVYTDVGYYYEWITYNTQRLHCFY